MLLDAIVLNGGSSSGKSSIARALQQLLPAPFVTFGIDDLLAALPDPGAASGDVIAFAPDGTVTPGPGFSRLEAAWWRGVAAMARAGLGVIVDDVFLGGAASQALLEEGLAGLQVLWIGVRCSAAVATAREMDREDRVTGMAARQADLVHEGVHYDLEVDTAQHPAEACARLIAAHAAPHVR